MYFSETADPPHVSLSLLFLFQPSFPAINLLINEDRDHPIRNLSHIVSLEPVPGTFRERKVPVYHHLERSTAINYLACEWVIMLSEYRSIFLASSTKLNELWRSLVVPENASLYGGSITLALWTAACKRRRTSISMNKLEYSYRQCNIMWEIHSLQT